MKSSFKKALELDAKSAKAIDAAYDYNGDCLGLAFIDERDRLQKRRLVREYRDCKISSTEFVVAMGGRSALRAG